MWLYILAQEFLQFFFLHTTMNVVSMRVYDKDEDWLVKDVKWFIAPDNECIAVA